MSHTRIRSPAAGQGEGAASPDPQLQPGLSLDVAVPRRGRGGCAQQLLSPPAQPPEARKAPNQQDLQMFCLPLEGSCDGCVWGRRSQMCVQPGGWDGGEGGGEENWARFPTQEMLQIL